MFDPVESRGVAFTAAERTALGLSGRLPSGELTLDDQATRAYEQLQRQETNLAKNVYLDPVQAVLDAMWRPICADAGA